MSANQENALIQVRNLGKSFGDLKVLQGITVDIHQGDVVCVIGPSGSGKSTFLRCLNRLEEATEGSIFFDGEDIVDYLKKYDPGSSKTPGDGSGRGRCPGNEAFRAGWPGRQGQCVSGPAVRRTEAENRHCPRSDDEAGSDAV